MIARTERISCRLPVGHRRALDAYAVARYEGNLSIALRMLIREHLGAYFEAEPEEDDHETPDPPG